MTERIAQLLKRRIGLDMDSVGELTVARAIEQRRRACGDPDLDAYWRRLNASESEQQELVEAVVVGETWFFRYPESFRSLQQQAFAALTRLAGRRGLRILCIPCSSGEEPYSIVMSLLDAGLAPTLFQVDAFDVSEQALAQAQAGVYGRNAFRGTDLAYRERYFLPGADGHHLSAAVRDRVRLAAANLLEPGFLAGEEPYDFVFCRNLLIYFDRDTQLRVLEVLKRLLAVDGTLYIGPAEANLFSLAGLRPLGVAQSFAFQRAPAPAEPPATAPRPRPKPQSIVPAPRAKPVPAPAQPMRAKPVPAPRPVATANGLAEIRSLADRGHYREALASAQGLLERQGPAAEVFYWLGLLHEVQGASQLAQQHYRKVLYLEPAHAEALAHLATLLVAQGDELGAQRLRQRAGRGVKFDGQA